MTSAETATGGQTEEVTWLMEISNDAQDRAKQLTSLSEDSPAVSFERLKLRDLIQD